LVGCYQTFLSHCALRRNVAGALCVPKAGLCVEEMKLVKFPGVELQLLSLPARAVVVYLLMCGSQHMLQTAIIVCDVACQVLSVNAPWYIPKTILHTDLLIPTVREEITKHSIAHKDKLLQHKSTNTHHNRRSRTDKTQTLQTS
jgi:hypothetical protein